MPKARNSKVDEALALYQQGLKLIEIARKLDIPEGTVRRWKCTYKWDSERSQPEKPNARKRGGQPATETGPHQRATRGPRSSASTPSIYRRRRWRSSERSRTPIRWICSGTRSASPTRPSSGPRRSPTSRTPKTRPSRRSRTAAAPSPGARSGKCSRPGTSRPTL